MDFPVDDDLPDPNALFMQMQAREATIPSPVTLGDDLPDLAAMAAGVGLLSEVKAPYA